MSETRSQIKIFVSCHKDCEIPDLKLFYPIQVGTAISERYLDDMLHDDTGDNISCKNKSYCELTAQYWAWKNADADYYGFFHYRRYFSFSDERFPANAFGEIIEAYNDRETLKKYCLNDETIAKTVEKYDIVIPVPGGFEDKKLTLEKQYALSPVQHESDLQFVMNVLREEYPAMYPYAVRYLRRNKGYFCNMFIMKKDIFAKYSEWLFHILERHERAVDISDYSSQAYRVHGFLAERLCGIYLDYLEKTTDLKILKLQRIFFKNVDKSEPILPAFCKNNVPVVFAANNFYAPYLSALLQSIKEHSSKTNNYDLLILNKDISLDNQKILRQQIAAENFSLRFIDVKKQMQNYTKLPLRGHFKEETYFRLLLPDILPDYNKILYLDSDMVVCADIAELFAEDTTGYLLAACKDADTAGLYNGFEPNKKQYMDTVLKIKKPYEYFQAGVILFNLEEFRKTYTAENMMRFAMSYQWELLDQDVLNYLAQGKTKFVNMEWNVMMDWRGQRIEKIISLAPYYLYDEYMRARKQPKIIHYAGPDKPWHNPTNDFAEIFWDYARRTPYYETAMVRMLVRMKYNPKKKRPLLDNRFLRSIAGVLFPAGTKRRSKLKKLLRLH